VILAVAAAGARLSFSSLYAASNIAAGEVIGSPHPRHRAIEFHELERWFAELTTKLRPASSSLRRRAERRHRPTERDQQRDPVPHIWAKTAGQTLESIARYGQRINQTGH